MNHNAALCYLMGTADASLSSEGIEELRAESDGAVLWALCCARAEDLDNFAVALDGLGSDVLQLISAYCLMMGLSGRVQTAFMLFDALKASATICPVIWLDLARLQAAWSYVLPALRSETMYCRLSGQEPQGLPPRPVMARTEPGPIHLLNGDLPSVRRV